MKIRAHFIGKLKRLFGMAILGVISVSSAFAATCADCGYPGTSPGVCASYTINTGCSLLPDSPSCGTTYGSAYTHCGLPYVAPTATPATPTPTPVAACTTNSCTGITCSSGTKYYLQYTQDVSAYTSAGYVSGTASSSTCEVPTNNGLNRQLFYVMCGSSAPTSVSGITSCSDNSNLTYYTGSSYPCGGTVQSCTTGGTPTPSPTATPSCTSPTNGYVICNMSPLASDAAVCSGRTVYVYNGASCPLTAGYMGCGTCGGNTSYCYNFGSCGSIGCNPGYTLVGASCVASGTVTPTPAVCNEGDYCSNGSSTGMWSNYDNCCMSGVQNNTCLSGSITCTSVWPAPTAASLPNICKNGMYCTNGSGTEGIWDQNQYCCAASGTCIAAIAPLTCSTGYAHDLYGGPTGLWNTTGTTYGSLAGSIPPGSTLACVKTCTPPATRLASDPTKCDCSAIAGATYNVSTGQCVSCPYSGQIMDANGNCSCPNGYEIWNASACRPKLPSNEYVRNASGYPVCTDPTVSAANSRMSVKYNLSGMNVSGTDVPLYSNTVTVNGTSYPVYPYATKSGTPPDEFPVYLYANRPHCACIGQSYKAPPYANQNFVRELASPLAGDTYDVINSVDSKGFPNKTYGMVATHKTSTLDGRLGTAFQAGTSSCACPNVNEVSTLVSSVNPQYGVVCAPPASLKSDANVVFSVFDPVKDAASVISPSSEPVDNSGAIASVVSLPVSAAATQSLIKYNRHIWKCQLGYYLDIPTGTCKWDVTKHDCDSNSPLPALTREGKAFPAWANIINKRLSCCMNDMTTATTSSTVKYDCVDNSAFAKTATFNAIWAEDPSTLGGQLNALILASKNYQPLTGWYTTEGKRCSEFSEFSNTPIIPGTVNPVSTTVQQTQISGTFVASGAAIPMPTGAAFTAMITGLGTKAAVPNPNSGAAVEINNARRCPILVRAALVTHCPANSSNPNSPHLTANVSGVTRCPYATTAEVMIRVEQVFTIAGQDSFKTFDTTVDQNTAASLNMSDLIRKKDLNQCLPGMRMGPEGCIY